MNAGEVIILVFAAVIYLFIGFAFAGMIMRLAIDSDKNLVVASCVAISAIVIWPALLAFGVGARLAGEEE